MHKSNTQQLDQKETKNAGDVSEGVENMLVVFSCKYKEVVKITILPNTS